MSSARWTLSVALVTSLALQIPAQEPPPCVEPLDDTTLTDLVLNTWRPSVQPGGSLFFTLGVWECCVWVQPVNACVEWSVEPEGAATLEPLPFEDEPGGASLKLTVLPEAPHGTVVTLRANVEGGRRVLEAEAHVYTEEANPLVGRWVEEYQLECPTFVRGDVDENGDLEITDAVRVFEYLFLGADAPSCLQGADTNADGNVDISDGIGVLGFLFLGAEPPAPPYPDCGGEIFLDLGCEGFSRCGVPWGTPDMAIQEMLFEADGTFSVTWTPFEVYRDYWGTYTYDVETGTLDLQPTGGNNLPADMRCFPGSGFFIQDGTLILKNVWLGTHDPGAPATSRCGHAFR